jgi:AAA+ superfamily predicted ATPase
MKNKIVKYIQSGFNSLYIETSEEERVDLLTKLIAEDEALVEKLGGYQAYAWRLGDGLRNLVTGSRCDGTSGPDDVLFFITEMTPKVGHTVFLLHDFHLYFEESSIDPPKPVLLRYFKNTLIAAKKAGFHIIITGAKKVIPPEIDKLTTFIDFELPGPDELNLIVDDIAESAEIEVNGNRDLIVGSLRGLTTLQAADTLALSVVEAGKFDPLTIARHKAMQINQSGDILEVLPTDVRLDEIGGYENVKLYAEECLAAMDRHQSDLFNIKDRHKGILNTGLPGTAKSVLAKALAAYFGLACLRCDVGALFGKHVGDSEANTRRLINTAKAMAPVFIFLDEVDKSMGGGESGETDGGTTNRVMASIFTFLAEQQGVFVYATANNLDKLDRSDGALIRAGRFDRVFFTDLPHPIERKAIWEIHLRKRERDPANYDLDTLVEITDGFTGGEIEQAIKDAQWAANHENYKGEDVEDFEDRHLFNAIKNLVPISHAMAEKIAATRKFAATRCKPSSAYSVEPTEVETNDKRKISI